MATQGNEIFGRPVLLDMQRRLNDPGNYIAAEKILRESLLMQLLTWKPVASLTNTYKRTQITRVGQLRALNTDFAPKFAGGESTITTELGILGDSYEWDRILGVISREEVQAQVDAMPKAISNRFSDLMVNGNRIGNALEFNGFDAVATATGGDSIQANLDLTIPSDGNTLAFRRNLARIQRVVGQMVALGWRPVIIGNADVQTAINLGGDLVPAARTVSDYFNSRPVNVVAGAPLIDAGTANVYGTPVNDALGRPVYPVTQEDVIPSDFTTGIVTDIYVVGIGAGGLQGAVLGGMNGTSPVRFETQKDDAGAIRRIEMEMAAGLHVEDERAVVKFEDVKVG